MGQLFSNVSNRTVIIVLVILAVATVVAFVGYRGLNNFFSKASDLNEQIEQTGH